jgi:MFS family permease
MNTQPSRPVAQPPFRAPQVRSARNVMASLAVCMALQMTSYVMIVPLFARRFSDFGDGVAALGMSSMAYALTSTLAAPFMGALADRFGRRPLVLVSLAVYVLAFCGYLFAASSWTLILLRALAGAMTAGLIPAVTGIVADLVAEDRRAQWIGIVNGGASAGWIAGPLLGGLLYDHWGYVVPFAAAIGLALVTLIMAVVMVPETHPGAQAERRDGPAVSLRGSLKSLPVFVTLMAVSFVIMFAWAFVEPQLMFYAYDDLRWTSSQLGLTMSIYGVALTVGEFAFGHLSDQVGRKPVLILGLGLFSTQFAGLLLFHDFAWIGLSFLLAGLGNALFDPALSAYILDIAPPEQKARVMGFKSTAGSLGNMLGPALVASFATSLRPQGVFLIATVLVVLLALACGLALQAQRRFLPWTMRRI